MKAYLAYIHAENEKFWVEFPDVAGCFSDGDSLEEAIGNAQDALGLYLCTLIEQGEALPEANHHALSDCPPDAQQSYIVTSPERYRSQKAVKKTLTLPGWLNAEAEKRGFNFSALLQQAVLQKLGL